MHTRFPDITVSLLEQDGKPVAQISMVRRALQNAGHEQEAREFTDRAFTAEEDLGKSRGMISLEESLARLVRAGVIDPEEAAARSARPEELASLLR
jgi:Tfp pilus assembly pilus retraction ATPase PilT